MSPRGLFTEEITQRATAQLMRLALTIYSHRTCTVSLGGVTA